MKREQTQLENDLWEGRLALVRAQEERVKIAVNKYVCSSGALDIPYSRHLTTTLLRHRARITATPLSAHDARSLEDGFARELATYDRERVLPALDGARRRQQLALARLGVPTMHAANDDGDGDGPDLVVSVRVCLCVCRDRVFCGSPLWRCPATDGRFFFFLSQAQRQVVQVLEGLLR
jgi:hypothetical protein